MDGHGEYSSLERSRLLRSVLDGGTSGSAGSNGSHPTSVSEFVGRAVTPTTLTLAQYHSRYGQPSPMPGSNLAVMSSLISGAHNTEARKAFLIDFQQYWSTHTDNFPRYLMTGGLYPPYPSLLPGTAESLSLLGAGVACVASGAATGAGPSHPQHVAHYQRLLEMQKQACLASMSAAASHHSALYGISASSLPPFLDHTPFPTHGATPFSLVKQEPRELSCTEKTTKQCERRAVGFKVDLDLNRTNKEAISLSSSSALANTQNTQLKEPKLSPSTSNGSSVKVDKRSTNSLSSPGNNNGHQNGKKSCTHSSTNCSLVPRHSSESVRSKCTSPSNRPTQQAPLSKGTGSSSGCKKAGSKSSLSSSKLVRTSSSGHIASTRSNLVVPSTSSSILSESPIISVPTQAAAPIPLATVQHDGVVLSALASPSSAAASLACTKPTVLKQQTDKLNRPSPGCNEHGDVRKSVTEANTSSGFSAGQSDTTPGCEDIVSHNQGSSNESRNINISTCKNNGVATNNLVEDSRLVSDDSSDIVVDSTENDDIQAEDTPTVISRSDQDRTIEETTERVAFAADNFSESITENVNSSNCSQVSQDSSNTPTLLSVTRIETSSSVTCSGSSSGTRTVYAKTQPVPSLTVSDCVQMTSSITTQASTSALPYYHTLYSKPQGVRRVHATTFVPEVGVFKGPSIKTLAKCCSSLPSSSGTSALSPENRCKQDPRPSNTIYTLSPNGHFRANDSTPSPSLVYPLRDIVSLSDYSSSVSPGIIQLTTEISSTLDSASLDSASVRSQSIASFHSVPEVGDSDDSSDGNENSLVIDHENYDNNERTNDESFNYDQRKDTSKKYISHESSCTNEFLPTRHRLEVNDVSTLKNNVAEHDGECSNAMVVFATKSEKVEKVGTHEITVVCNSPMPETTLGKSFTSLESIVRQVPYASRNKACSETAIDYSLPKSVSVGSSYIGSCNLADRSSNSSQLTSTTSNIADGLNSAHQHNKTKSTFADIKELEQTPQKKMASLSKSFPRSSFNYSSTMSTKLITSPTKPLIRHEVTAVSIGKSLPIPCSPHKRPKLISDHPKLHTLTPSSMDVLSKVTRRLRLQEDDSKKRCGSAPPSASSFYLKPLRATTLTSSEASSEKEREVPEKLESSNDHSLGNNIPVGIAVAQIRPHHIQQPRELLTSEGLSRDIRHVSTSFNNKNTTQTSASVSASGAALAPSLVVAGRTVNSSPWLQQMPFTLHPAMNSSGTTFDPSFQITAPNGFKFAHDSLTGQFFLVPSGDFVEQGGGWPAANFAASVGTGNTHFQANVTLPISISGTEGRDGRIKGESNVGKSIPSENRTDNFIPDQDVISKERTGLGRGVEKHHVIAQTTLGGNNNNNNTSLGLITGNTAPATVVVNPVANITALSPPLLFKVDQPVLESRGCSPIVFEDVSSSLPILSTLSSLTSKKLTTCTIGVQTCDDLMKRSRKRKSSPPKLRLQDQAIQTVSHDISTLNPLSVECPELDSVDSLTHSLEEKTNCERASYNPFTDPQILQAADGLELLSALAEKRTKCCSLDDPKRIYPSPSDSFKSDSASIVAIEDTLSPVESEIKSGQCTPRRDVRRELSPKWSLPKKEPLSVSAFADFKAPPDVEIPDDSEVRVKLAEVQRQYKEKQKELAKLQGKKSDDNKPSKRGPGRPPKKKSHSKKSDDDSSSSPTKAKDHHQPHRKKRPAEELVDRVFRKLPPVIKTSKVSRSIHYVKSKTGPFFRRKSASSSVKRNKDLFGFDESNWPSFSERKHQEKIKVTGSFSGNSKSRHRSSSSQSEDGKHSHDAGNIFTNLESFGGDYLERRVHTLKHHSYNNRKPVSSSGSISLKTDPCSISSHQESGLGLLAKFALTVTTASLSSTSVSLSLSSLATSTSSSTLTSGNQSSISSFSSSTFSTNICSSSIYCSSLYNSCSNMYSMGSASNGSNAPNITFGSLSSLMSSPSSGLMSFSSPNLVASSLNSSTPTTTSTSTFAQAGVLNTPTTPMSMSPTSTTSASIIAASPLFPSPGIHHSTTGESSSGTSNCTTSCSIGSMNSSTTSSSTTNSSTSSVRDISPSKRKLDEADSDTDTSDTSPNKKRKPGRPRKINPEKSSGGTETIWAKKSSAIGLLQVSESSCVQTKDGNGRKLDSIVMKPLFLDEEWTRRRSERIFLNESSPLPSPAISPSPRGEPVWKLSHFMPKSKKVQDNKCTKEGDKTKTDSTQDHLPPLNIAPTLSSSFSSPTVSSTTVIKTEGKELVSSSSSVFYTAATKSTEISTPNMEDAKIIVKLEHSFKISSLSSPSSEKAQNSPEICHIKKKKSRKTAKTEQSPITSSSPSPTNLEKKKEIRAEEHSKIKLQKAKSLHDLTQRVKKKFSKTGFKKQRDDQLKKDCRPGKKRQKIRTDSSDNEPLASYRENPSTPEPKSCKLQPSDLREGLKVLYLTEGLFHEGTVKALQPPDVYGVLTAGQRGNRPHIVCLEEILKWAVLDVRPGSLRYLPEGTRVCAFWSQQFSCLYPGTVAKSTPINNGKKVIVPVDFDDGDNGRIELDHIRLLPSDFPIVEYEPDPLEVLPKRKQRTMSESSDARKSMDSEPKMSKRSKSDIDDGDDEGSKTESDASGPSGASIRNEYWKWEGKGTKRPGLKGKAKKLFYRAVSRGKEIVRVGDSAVLVSRDKSNCPYMGRIGSLWESWSGQKMVKVHWYYHPEETESDKALVDPTNALFESQHSDENDVQSIAYKCEVVTHANYKRQLSEATKKGEQIKANLFYLAGFYNPATKNLTFYPGVS